MMGSCDHYQGVNNYDDPNCQKFMSSTTATLRQHGIEQVLQQDARNPPHNATKSYTHERQLHCRDRLSTKEENVMLQKKDTIRKRQNDMKDQDKKLINTRSEQISFDKTSSNISNANHNSTRTRYLEDIDESSYKDSEKRVLKAVHTNQTQSHASTGINIDTFKQFMGNRRMFRIIGRKKTFKKSDKRNKTSSKIFKIFSKSDKQHIIVQLSIWFPCLFPRPTFKSLKKAIASMTTRVFHKLCKCKILDLNKQISKDKAQRTLFRKEKNNEGCPKNTCQYFSSSVVPEGQKRGRSFSFNSNRETTATSSEEHHKNSVFSLKQLSSNIVDSCKLEQSPISVSKSNWGESLMYFEHDKHVRGNHGHHVRTSSKDRQKPNYVNMVENSHIRFPEWFKSMIIKQTSIYIHPVCSNDEKEKGSDAKRLVKHQRRILLTSFLKNDDISFENEHMYISVREQETRLSRMQPCIDTSCSAVPPYNVILAANENTNISTQKLQISRKPSILPVKSRTTGCAEDSLTITSSAGPSCNEPITVTENMETVKYEGELFEKFSLENRTTIRDRISSCLQDKLLSKSRSGMFLAESKKALIDKCCLNEFSLSRPEICNKHSYINILDSRNVDHKVKDTNSVDYAFSISQIMPNVKNERRNKSGLLDIECITSEINNDANTFSNILLTGPTMQNIDTNLNKNIELQEVMFCNEYQNWQKCQPSIEPPQQIVSGNVKAKTEFSREPLFSVFRQMDSSIMTDTDLKQAMVASGKISSCRRIAASKGELYQKGGEITVGGDEHQNKHKKTSKKVRFGDVNSYEYSKIDCLNKCNSSVHGMQEVFDNTQTVFDDVMDSQEVCPTTGISLNICKPTSIIVPGVTYFGQSVAETTEQSCVSDRKKGCGSNQCKYCHIPFYYDQDRFLKKPNLILGEQKCKMYLGNDERLAESTSTGGCALKSNRPIQFLHNICRQENTASFSRTEPLDEKSKAVHSLNDIYRQGQERTSSALMRTLGLSPRESLIKFVKEQWRTCYANSPVQIQIPYTVAEADNSHIKKYKGTENVKMCEDSDSTSRQISKLIDSHMYWDTISSSREHDVECERDRKSHSVKKVLSYEAMCAERRENYQQLCRTLAKHYQSLSPKDVHVVDNIIPNTSTFPENIGSDTAKPHTTSKTCNESDNMLLKSRNIADSCKNNITDSVIQGHTSSGAQDLKDKQSRLKKTLKNVKGKSISKSQNITSPSNILSQSSIAEIKSRPKVNTSSITSELVKEYQIKESGKQVKQTQTSPIVSYTHTQNEIPDDLSSMLELSFKEAQWFVGNIRSGPSADPDKSSELLCIIFALDKLLSRYFQSKYSKKQCSGYLRKKSTDAAEAGRVARKPSSVAKNRKNLIQRRQYVLAKPGLQLLLRRGHKHIDSQVTSDKINWTNIKCHKVESRFEHDCSVNNGQDTPPMFSHNRSTAPPLLYHNQSTVNTDLAKLPWREYLLNGHNKIIATDSGKQTTDDSINHERLFQEHNNTYKSSPRRTLDTAQTSKSPGENISRSPCENISRSPGELDENISSSPGQNTNASLVKEFLDAVPVQPSRLSLAQKPVSIQHLSMDAPTSHYYSRAPILGQTTKRDSLLLYKSSDHESNIRKPISHEETKKAKTLPTDVSKSPLKKITFKIEDSHTQEIFNKHNNMETRDPQSSTSGENRDFDIPFSTAKIRELPKSYRSVQSSSPPRNFSLTSTDFQALPTLRITPHQQYGRLDIGKTTQVSSTVDAVQVTTAANNYPTEIFWSNVKPLSSATRATPPTIAEDQHQITPRADAASGQMSAAQLWFREICAKVNNITEETGFSNTFLTDPQVSSTKVYKTKIDAKISETHPVSKDNQHPMSKFVTVDSRDISNSPYEPCIERFSRDEVDNRLLNPSKNYDVALLQDSQACVNTTESNSILFQNHINFKLNQLQTYAEDSSSGEIREEKSPLKSYENLSRVNVVDQRLNSGENTAQKRLQNPSQKTSICKNNYAKNCASICTQTCTCISKPNGICRCGYLPKDSCTPTETIISSPSVYTKNGQREIYFKTKRQPVQNTNIRAEVNFSRNTSRSKQSSPSQIRYRNKKCQIGNNLMVKSGNTDTVELAAICSPFRAVNANSHQFESKTGKCMSPGKNKFMQSKLRFDQTNTQSGIHKEKHLCSKCKQQMEQPNIEQLDTSNLASKVLSSSDGDCEQICPCNNVQSCVTNYLNTCATHECSKCVPNRERCQFQESNFPLNSNQDSNIIFADMSQDICNQNWIQVTERQPIIHIRYRSDRAGNSQKYHNCSNKNLSLGQQLENEITGIIENTRLLQQQANQLKKKYRCLDRYQWSTNIDKRPGTTRRCECCKNDLTMNCRNNKNHNKNIDENTNANPSCDNILNEVDTLQDLNIENGNSKTCIDEYHTTIEELTNGRNSATSPTILVNEMSTRKAISTNTENDDECNSFHSRNTKRLQPEKYASKRRSQLNSYPTTESNIDKNINSLSEEQVSWKVEMNQNRNRHPQDPTEKYDEKTSSFLPMNSNGCSQHYFVDDPWEDAYQYMRTHFPTISRSLLNKEDTDLILKYRSSYNFDNEGEYVREKQTGKTQAIVEGKRIQSIIAGRKMEATIVDTETQALVAARETQALVAGKETQSLAAGTETHSLVAGRETQTLIAGRETQSLVAGRDTEALVAGTETQSLVADREAQLFDADGETQALAAGRKTKALIAGRKTRSSGLCGESERIIDLSRMGNKQSLKKPNLHEVKPNTDYRFPGGTWAKLTHCTPSSIISSSKNARVVSEVCENFDVYTTQHTHVNIYLNDSNGTIKNQYLQQKSHLPEKRKCPVFTAHMNNSTSFLSRNYWQCAYKIGSLKQSRLLPEPDINEQKVHINHYRRNALTSPENNINIVRHGSAVIQDFSDISSIRGPFRTTQSVGTVVSVRSIQQPCQGSGATEEDLSNVSFTCTDHLFPSSYRSNSNVSITHSQIVNMPELRSPNASNRRGTTTRKNKTTCCMDIDSDQVVDRPFIQCDKEKCGSNKPRPTVSNPDNPIDPSSNISLISTKKDVNSPSKVAKSKRNSRTATCRKNVNSQWSSKSYEEESHIVDNTDILSGIDRDKWHIGCDAHDVKIMSPILKVKKQTRPLPRIRLSKMRSYKLEAIDSQDSSHGIEDIPLDSAFVNIKQPQQKSQIPEDNITTPSISNCDTIIGFDSSESLHKREVFARPLPIPQHNRYFTTYKNTTKVKTSLSSEDIDVPRCSHKLSNKRTSKRQPPTMKRKLGLQELRHLTLGQECQQFEISMHSPVAQKQSQVLQNSTDKSAIIYWDSPEYFKTKNSQNNVAYTCTSTSHLHNIAHVPDFVGNCPLRFTPKSSADITQKCRDTDVCQDDMAIAISYPDRFKLSSYKTKLDIPVNFIQSRDRCSESKLLISNQMTLNTANQWRTCFLGCAEVVTANDDIVVIQGAYIKRPSSFIKIKSNYGMEEDKLECKHRQILPFRLTLSRVMAIGGAVRITGAYSRRQLNSDRFLTWNLVADKF